MILFPVFGAYVRDIEVLVGGYTKDEIRAYLATDEKEWLEMERELYAGVRKDK